MSSKLGAVVAALALAIVAIAAGALLPARFRATPAAPPKIAVETSLVPSADVTARIAAFTTLQENGTASAADLAALGLAHLSHARIAADPASLTAAEEAFTGSLDIEPQHNFEAFVGSAALANARHDFSGSVDWARKAIALNPHDAAPYGLLGDALFELGHTKAADRAYQDMVDIRPDMASYVRASYALASGGNIRGATAAMRLALQAAASPVDAAWVRHQLGDIFSGRGRQMEAARQNRIGMRLAPGYAPPKVGLAESLIARGRLDDAIPLMEDAVETLPALEYEMALGELYEAAGRGGEAEAQYRRAARVLADYRTHGMLPDADLILFYVDHGFRMGAALEEARAIYVARPTGKTADALAWALHRNGLSAEALPFAREALAESPEDPGYLFHAGMIRDALGRDTGAETLLRRALEIDPVFSVLQAPIASYLLAN